MSIDIYIFQSFLSQKKSRDEKFQNKKEIPLLTGLGSFHQRNNSFREHNTLFSEHMRPSSYNTTRPTPNTADPYFTMTELSPINILPFKENY